MPPTARSAAAFGSKCRLIQKRGDSHAPISESRKLFILYIRNCEHIKQVIQTYFMRKVVAFRIGKHFKKGRKQGYNKKGISNSPIFRTQNILSYNWVKTWTTTSY